MEELRKVLLDITYNEFKDKEFIEDDAITFVRNTVNKALDIMDRDNTEYISGHQITELINVCKC